MQIFNGANSSDIEEKKQEIDDYYTELINDSKQLGDANQVRLGL